MKLRRLLEVPGLAVDDAHCDGRGRGWSEGESSADFALVLVRRGCFRRRVDGRDSVLDPADSAPLRGASIDAWRITWHSPTGGLQASFVARHGPRRPPTSSRRWTCAASPEIQAAVPPR